MIIFAQRAATAHAKTQVELAQYQYLLAPLDQHVDPPAKAKGGIGMKGPGEKEIETDRRVIRDRIALLRKQLAGIDKQMATQRKNRGQMIRVALVGYTNVGKSTLMTLMSKSDVFAENKLFATLDTTVRKVVIDNLPFLLSDTVGFIRKLPTQLIEKLQEHLGRNRESDMLLHVIDVSHPSLKTTCRWWNARSQTSEAEATASPPWCCSTKLTCSWTLKGSAVPKILSRAFGSASKPWATM